MKPVKFTNSYTGEKFIHREKANGTVDFLYGPKDTPLQKMHGHAVIGANGSVIFNRNPIGE